MTLRRKGFPLVWAGAAGVLVAAGLSFAPGARAENWLHDLRGTDSGSGSTGNVNLFLGARLLDSADWKPVDKQPEVGLDFDYTPERWRVSLCGTVFYSRYEGSASGVDVDANTLEFQLGARKIWSLSQRFRPYVGGGGSYLLLDYDVSSGPEAGANQSHGFGLWAGGGTYFKLSASWHVGVDARWSWVNVDAPGTTANAGGLHAGLTVGYRWSEF